MCPRMGWWGWSKGSNSTNANAMSLFRYNLVFYFVHRYFNTYADSEAILDPGIVFSIYHKLSTKICIAHSRVEYMYVHCTICSGDCS